MTENEPARLPAGAAGAPGASRTGNAVARRGDLVVIHLRHRDWKDGQPREYDDFWLGQVTSVTRAGLVRLYRPAGTFALGHRRARPARQGAAAAVPVVRARRDQEPEGDRRPRCPRHGGLPHLAGPRGPRPRLRHPQRSQGGAAPAPAGPARLGTAPRRRRAWEAAWREARPLLSAAVRAHGEEFRRLSDLYDAAVTAANNAYREQHEQAAGTGSAAA